MDDMMTTARSVQNAQAANSNPDVSVWRQQVNKNYNAALAGALGAINPVMHHINVSANAYYTEQISQGVAAQDAYEATVTRFDALMGQVDTTKFGNVVAPKAQTEFIMEHVVTTESLKAVGNGTISFLDAFAGVPLNILEAELVMAKANKTLTEDEIKAIIANYE
jgi:hypothetical protein